jgi:hypothetical protein
MTVLVIVLWLTVWRIVATGVLFESWWGLSCRAWAAGFSPWEAVLLAAGPYMAPEPALGLLGTPVNLFLLVSVAVAAALNGVAVMRVRAWAASREAQPVKREDETWTRGTIENEPTQAKAPAAETVEDRPAAKGERTRRVWDNPILWREMRTWAYGRKVLVIRVVYLTLFALAAGSLYQMAAGGSVAAPMTGSVVLTGLFLLSLVLVNAQAVTSLTNERDGRALDLLLVSDLTPKEFVYGKLGGVLYNTKEMIVLPMLLCVGLWKIGVLDLDELLYLLVGLAVLYGFAAMLGVHAGMAYHNSRSAIATSLGTVFFLFLGVATCIRMMVAFGGSFEAQLPFLGLLVFGGAGLYLALGVRNPSTAIFFASFTCPLATFYAIASFYLERIHLAFVAIVGAYGFTIVAMLIPAVDEFDVATGRTTVDEP